MDRKQLTKELNRVADANPYAKKRLGEGWRLVHDRVVLDLSVSEFWSNFWADDAVYPMDKYARLMKYTNISKTKWARKQFVVKQVVPIPGAPLGLKETRTIVTHTLIEKSSERLIVESSSESLDAPSGDAFLVKYTVMALGTKKAPDNCILVRLAFVEFLKFSFFKAIIISQAEDGIDSSASLWYDNMKREGLLKAKPKPVPKPEPPKAEPPKVEEQKRESVKPTAENKSPKEKELGADRKSAKSRKSSKKEKVEERKQSDHEEVKQRSQVKERPPKNMNKMNLTIMEQHDQLDCDIRTNTTHSRLTYHGLRSQYSMRGTSQADRRSVMALGDKTIIEKPPKEKGKTKTKKTKIQKGTIDLIPNQQLKMVRIRKSEYQRNDHASHAFQTHKFARATSWRSSDLDTPVAPVDMQAQMTKAEEEFERRRKSIMTKHLSLQKNAGRASEQAPESRNIGPSAAAQSQQHDLDTQLSPGSARQSLEGQHLPPNGSASGTLMASALERPRDSSNISHIKVLRVSGQRPYKSGSKKLIQSSSRKVYRNRDLLSSKHDNKSSSKND